MKEGSSFEDALLGSIVLFVSWEEDGSGRRTMESSKMVKKKAERLACCWVEMRMIFDCGGFYRKGWKSLTLQVRLLRGAGGRYFRSLRYLKCTMEKLCWTCMIDVI